MKFAFPSPRVLLGPGPSTVGANVLEALGRAPVGHLDPELFDILDRLRGNLRVVFGTEHAVTLPLSGTGMAGMECCLANSIAPGDRVVIGVNGFFGGRMVEIARRLGAEVHIVEAEWGRPLEPAMFQQALGAGKVKLVACVHAETSTGVETQLAPIGALAHEFGAIFLADAVTSLGGIPVDIDACGVDICYSGSQKCIGAPPGLSPIAFNGAALKAAQSRSIPCSSWYFDWQLLMAYYDTPHAYHHTVPVNLLFALDAALIDIVEEGCAARFRRHREMSSLLLEELREIGILPFAPANCRLPTLNTVKVPDIVADEALVRKRLLTEYGIEIGGGLGELKGKIWRIGTMGASATQRNVLLLVNALRHILNTQ